LVENIVFFIVEVFFKDIRLSKAIYDIFSIAENNIFLNGLTYCSLIIQLMNTFMVSEQNK